MGLEGRLIGRKPPKRSRCRMAQLSIAEACAHELDDSGDNDDDAQSTRVTTDRVERNESNKVEQADGKRVLGGQVQPDCLHEGEAVSLCDWAWTHPIVEGQLACLDSILEMHVDGAAANILSDSGQRQIVRGN